MTDDLKLLLVVAAPILFATTIGFAIAWVRARERALRAQLDAKTALEKVERGSVAVIGQAVDSVAIEVERIGEAQRFLTRQLSDRDPEASRSPKQ
ncbi:MAG: hypothetical protein ACHQQR_01605 [Gemmatimonadales bacterium]